MGVAVAIPLGMVAMQTATATEIVYDPFGLLFLLLFAMAVVGLAVYIFVSIQDMKNSTRINDAEVSMLNAQTNSILAQTNNMNNLVQSTVLALDVNSATYQQAMQTLLNQGERLLNIYQMQVQNDITFKNTLLELLGLQLVTQDIRQFMSDKLRAQLASQLKSPDVEIIEYPQPTQPTTQPQQSRTQ